MPPTVHRPIAVQPAAPIPQYRMVKEATLAREGMVALIGARQGQRWCRDMRCLPAEIVSQWF